MKHLSILLFLATTLIAHQGNAQCISTSYLETITLNSNGQSINATGLIDSYTELNIERLGTIDIQLGIYHITLTDTFNNVLTHDSTDFSYVFASPGTYRLHFFEDKNCSNNFDIFSYDITFNCLEVTYSGSFLENRDLNDGTLVPDKAVSVSHSRYDQEKFNGSNGEDFIVSNKISLANLPTGLTGKVIKSNDSTLIFSLEGSATNHKNIDDVDNITLVFTDSAFTKYTAVENRADTISNIAIEFIEEHTVGSTGDFAKIDSAVTAAENFDIIRIMGETFVENDIFIDKTLRIIGAGARNTVIKAHDDYDAASGRIFSINGGIMEEIEISDLTLKNGKVTFLGGAGILANSPIKLVNVIFEDNIVDGMGGPSSLSGGALYVHSKTTIKNCLFNNNLIRSASAGSRGGAAYIGGSDEKLIENTTFYNNRLLSTDNGYRYAGALYVDVGGGKTGIIRNCTFTSNSTDTFGTGEKRGGAVVLNPYSSTSTITIENSIIYGNSGIEGKDFYNYGPVGSTLNVRNTIYQDADAFNGVNITGLDTLNSSSDPLLDSLRDNDGISYTVAVMAGSPAIDAGYTANAPENDQRGFERDVLTDIGAYEFGACDRPKISVANDSVARCGNGEITLLATSSAGNIIWYDSLSGGDTILDGGNYSLNGDSLTINNLSSTTSFYAGADDSGCASSSRTAIVAEIKSLPSAPIADDSVSRCGGGLIVFSATSSEGDVIWFDSLTGGSVITDGGNYSLSGDSLTINNLLSTTSFYAETEDNSCASATRTKVVANIKALPLNTVTVSNEVLSSEETTTGVAYQWLDCDDNFSDISGETSQNYTATVSGNYAVEVDLDGCVDTSNCEMVTISTNLEEYEFDKSLTLFPNPTTDALNIINNNEGQFDVIVRDLSGREVMNVYAQENNTSLDLSILKSGLYMIEVWSAGKKGYYKVMKD